MFHIWTQWVNGWDGPKAVDMYGKWDMLVDMRSLSSLMRIRVTDPKTGAIVAEIGRNRNMSICWIVEPKEDNLV